MEASEPAATAARGLAAEPEAAAARVLAEMTEAAESKPTAVAGPETPLFAKPAREKPATPPLFNGYFIALISAVIWAAGVCAYAVGYQGWSAFNFEPFRVTVLVLLAIAPVPLRFAAAHLVRRSSALALETRRAYALSQAMAGPAAHAAGQTADVVKALRDEIAQAAQAAERARAELAAMRDALSLQARELDAACVQAVRTTGSATDQLGRERERMLEVGQTLDHQAASVVSALDRQAHMVRDAAELAQVQLREAESALAARAADLAAAAGEAQDAARVASDDLSRQTLRLETAGSGVAEQIRSVEEGLSQQRAALVQEAYQLRADQEAFSVQVETQRAQMVEILSAARTASVDLGDVSSKSAEALRDLVQAAGRHFQELAEASEGERSGFEERTREALERFVALASSLRDDMSEATARALTTLSSAAEEARQAAEAAADAARARVDNLGEAAFEAGKRADEAFEARMALARRLIDDSAAVVEATGARTAQRIDADVKAMSAAVAQVEEALAQIDGRASRLPEQAKARVDEIRAAAEQGLEALAAAARRAVEETEAADAAFQERIKRNHEMLSEAVRMMGVVSGESPAPPRRRENAAAEPAPAEAASDSARDSARDSAQDAGLRGRLRLTRTDADAEVRNVFEAPKPRAEGEAWSWRDVLGGLDPNARAADGDEDAVAARLIDEIKKLGVDPQALLPRTRVDEAAAAWLRADADGARVVIRRVAPAAVRRISRRVITDRSLRSLAERYVARFAARVGEERTEAAASNLLASEQGRSFLLIDAAIGDLG
jgi:hypothetical protein